MSHRRLALQEAHQPPADQRAALQVGGNAWGYLCLHRETAKTSFSRDEARFVQRIAPHLAELGDVVATIVCRSRTDLPEGVTSWQMFDKMLHEANVVITPGAGFGGGGEGYFRISAFNSRANVEEVCRRIVELK